jgi:nucleotide-binding universal stress UspA family protein
MMLEHGPILVPLDGSEMAEGALPYASALADRLRTHLVLVTVWEGTDSDLAKTFPALSLEVSESADRYFTEYLNGVKAKLPEPGAVRIIVRPGDAADEILNAARETEARAIAIGTHGRSGISRWLYGSTAGRLLRQSKLPVLAVGPRLLEMRRPRADIRKVMVPLDGSGLSEQALPVAAALARAANARVLLVRGVRWAVQAYPYTLPDAYVPQVDEELEKGAKEYLRGQEQQLKDVNVEAFVVRGAVADGLLEFIDEQKVDLVVMTTHARAGLARAALGSTADRLLQGHAPVLLIRPDEAR